MLGSKGVGTRIIVIAREDCLAQRALANGSSRMARKIAQLKGLWQMVQLEWQGRLHSSKGFGKWFSSNGQEDCSARRALANGSFRMARKIAQLKGLLQMIQLDGQGDCSAQRASANDSA